MVFYCHATCRWLALWYIGGEEMALLGRAKGRLKEADALALWTPSPLFVTYPMASAPFCGFSCRQIIQQAIPLAPHVPQSQVRPCPCDRFGTDYLNGYPFAYDANQLTADFFISSNQWFSSSQASASSFECSKKQRT